MQHHSRTTDAVPALQAALAPVLTLSEEHMLALVPPRAAVYFTSCANCDGGTQDNVRFQWDPGDPDRMTCPHCDHVYPSETYPMDKVQEVRSPAGNVIQYPYWERADGMRHFFQARMDRIKRDYMVARAWDFALLHDLTREAVYARRAALIINRFAEVYPDYCYKFDYPFRQVEWYDGEVAPESFRSGYRTSRWDWWAYMDIPETLVRAYDLIAGSGELEPIPGARERIVEDFFLPATRQVTANPDPLHNMSPVSWRSMIVVARVLQQPEYLHEVVDRLGRLSAQSFYYDGVWMEGAPSYHSQVIGGLSSVFANAGGHSDPPGYAHPETGRRFDDLDLEKDVPQMARVISALDAMRLPDGRLTPVHDTWGSQRRGALERSAPVLLPALGHAILGRGEAAAQMQVNLTWSGGYGHQHYDGLSMMLFAHGREMLADLGYTHTRYRPWSIASAAHNLVVVDYESLRSTRGTDGALRLFDAPHPDLQVVAADNPQVYPGVVTRYSRLLALVGLDEGEAYVVDVFSVAGGTQHDYFVHGDADHAQTATVTGAEGPLAMTPVETLLPGGMAWDPPTGEHHSGRATQRGYAYGFLRDSRVARPGPGVQQVAFRYEDSDLATRLHVVTLEGDELYVGMNPQIRPARESDPVLDDYLRPHMMLRRTGEPAASVFVSVIEPVSGEARIRSVTPAHLSEEGVVLVVDLGEVTDVVGLNARDVRGVWAGREMHMDGPLSHIRLRDGEVVAAYTTGTVSCGDLSLHVPPPAEAPLVGVERTEGGGAVLVGADWMDPAPLPGTVLILDHGDGQTHGYTVAGAEATEGGTRIRTVEDPGFEHDAATGRVKYVYHPHSEHAGPQVVRRLHSAYLRR